MRKMMIVAIVFVLMLMISSSSQALWHHPKLKMVSDKRIYEIGETITLSAENSGKKPVDICHFFGRNHIVIYNQKDELVYWYSRVLESGETLCPGDVRSVNWDQTYVKWIRGLNDFGSWTWVRAPNYGEQVPCGKYTAYHHAVGSVTFWIGPLDYPGSSDSHRQDNGNGDACLNWALNEHAQGREHAADS